VACRSYGRDEKCTQILVGDHSEDLGVRRKIILKYILEKQGENVWTGFIWIRIEINGRLL